MRNCWSRKSPKIAYHHESLTSLRSKCVSRFGDRLLSRGAQFTIPQDRREVSDFLEHVLPGLLHDIPVIGRQNVGLILNRASIHYRIAVRGHLHSSFPHWWIGLVQHFSWPPRSTELSNLYFFLRTRAESYRERLICGVWNGCRCLVHLWCLYNQRNTWCVRPCMTINAPSMHRV